MCVSALGCVSFDFLWPFLLVSVLSDAIFVFLIRETGRKDVGLVEWGGGRIWKELGERKQGSEYNVQKKTPISNKT